jgi:hypothetical protein
VRFHELLLCLAALAAPFAAEVAALAWANSSFLIVAAPLLAFVVISLPLLWLTGWLIEHTYG